MQGMVFGTRVLKYWVLGPSGFAFFKGGASARMLSKGLMAVISCFCVPLAGPREASVHVGHCFVFASVES